MAKRNDARKEQILEVAADKAARLTRKKEPSTLKARTAAYNLMRFDDDMRAGHESTQTLSPEEVKIKQQQALERMADSLGRLAKPSGSEPTNTVEY